MTGGFLAHRGLMAFAAATAMAEAGLLAVTAPGALPLAPQVSALPPLAVFHDLRWLFSARQPWPVFVLLLAGLILARSAVTAATVRLAWPRGAAPPAPAATLRSALTLTLFLCVLVSPIASLSFGVAILPFSWPYLASIPVMLAVSAVVSHGGLTGDWWRALPPPAAVGWLLADFAALSAAAVAITRLPAIAAVPAAGAAGLVNARAWYGVAQAAARAQRVQSARFAARARPVRVPRALLATVTVIALVIAATAAAFMFTTPGHDLHLFRSEPAAAGAGSPGRSGQLGQFRQPGGSSGADQPRVPAAGPGGRNGRGPVVLVIPGFGSSCCSRARSLAQVMPDAVIRQFSYRGVSPAGEPLPYGPEASNLPMSALGDRVAAQVRRLHDATGRPVDVVAESEGTLGVDALLAQHPDAAIGAVVLLSPIVAPGQGGDRGLAGRDVIPYAELSAMIWFVGGLSRYGTSGAQTLIDSVSHFGARLAGIAARRRPPRTLQVIPLADAVTLPSCRLPADVRVVPSLHGVLLGDPQTLRMVRAFLNGRPVPGGTSLRGLTQLVAEAASAWRMPQGHPPSPPCAR